jgi:eukaryotic-like serine/threonine-protein kinase
VALTAGQLLADRYRLRRRIAVGGMGEVWEAADQRLDRRVAVKVLKAELSGDTEFLHRFRTEARTTASLNHPGVAAVHDYGETAAVPDGPADTAYLVMELVEGEPLATVLARLRRLSPDQTLDVLEQAGHALQAAHERGLVHRDVKPGNILITPSGTVKITDFGIAKAVDAAPVTRSGMVMGTAHYIAPEQAMGHEAGPASDVYALGVVGYECLTGQRPFLSDSAVTVAMMHIRDTPPALPAGVPSGVRALIEATLVKDPRCRYATGGEFANAVAAVRTGLPLPPPVGLSMPNTGMPNASTPNPARLVPMVGMPAVGGPPTGTPVPAGPPTGTPVPPGISVPLGTPVQVGRAGLGNVVQVGSLNTAPTPTGPFRSVPPPQRPRHRAGVWVFVILLLLLALIAGGWAVARALAGPATAAATGPSQFVTAEEANSP